MSSCQVGLSREKDRQVPVSPYIFTLGSAYQVGYYEHPLTASRFLYIKSLTAVLKVRLLRVPS